MQPRARTVELRVRILNTSSFFHHISLQRSTTTGVGHICPHVSATHLARTMITTDEDITYCEVSWRTFMASFVPGAAAIPAAHAKRMPQLAHAARATRHYVTTTCAALNAVLAQTATKARFAATGAVRGALDDAAADAPVPTLALLAPSAPPSLPQTSRLSPPMARAELPWAHVALPLDIAEADADTGFSFGGLGARLCLRGDAAAAARARHARWARALLAHQQRTHAFGVCVSRHGGVARARVLRWDRAECVVSAPVDVAGEQFRRFLYRFGGLGREEAGEDCTAELASEEEVAALRAYDPQNIYLKGYHQYMLENMEEFPIYKVQCPAVSTDGSALPATAAETRTYLIGRPTFSAAGVVGKATRGFVAFEPAAQRMVFLKDQWPLDAGARNELGVVQHLNAHGVQNVATPLAGGDVRSGDGAAQLTMSDDWADVAARVHRRIVLQEVARPLDSHASAGELLRVCYDAVLAHKDAWEKAEVLHQDISDNNIMIDVLTGKGLLCDWDICQFKDERGSGDFTGYKAFPCGTRDFSGALHLMYLHKRTSVDDDLESFIYVLVFNAVRFYDHELSVPEGTFPDGKNRPLFGLFNCFFDFCPQNPHAPPVGTMKLRAIREGAPPVTLRDAESPLARFLAGVYKDVLQPHYEAISYGAKYEDDYEGAEWGTPERAAAEEKYRSGVLHTHDKLLEFWRPFVTDVATGDTQKPAVGVYYDQLNWRTKEPWVYRPAEAQGSPAPCLGKENVAPKARGKKRPRADSELEDAKEAVQEENERQGRKVERKAARGRGRRAPLRRKPAAKKEKA
ncbi:hypothetical protein PsYK624_098920 [Phanerochaete sordida]|uniref:Fungal-type protein kinase domain-containing protein n=1 Tax=Phanerochaete sordida TaxID=48140 RepID=A0A9P3LFP0_9APHY|nr:hypothetical protein PsYK624_098920 [Phanerochaete sordida]